MLVRSAVFSALACLIAIPFAIIAQDTQHQPAQNDTFSGNIVEISKERLTVSRSILGSQAEKRIFLLKPETKIEGKLRVKAKVTVGFITTDDGDVAQLIVVRQPHK